MVSIGKSPPHPLARRGDGNADLTPYDLKTLLDMIFKISVKRHHSLNIILGLFDKGNLFFLNNLPGTGIIGGKGKKKIPVKKMKKLAEIFDSPVDIFFRVKRISDGHLLCGFRHQLH